MFFGSFSWSFVYISLPFHIQAMSTWDASATLRWTGWILGITPLVTVVTAPLWGRLGGSGDPKTLYAVVQAVQGIAFFGMAIARTLPELFLSRLVLGVMGAASTFAFMSAGRSTDIREVRRQVAAVQSAMTVGQVIGPLAGAIAARGSVSRSRSCWEGWCSSCAARSCTGECRRPGRGKNGARRRGRRRGARCWPSPSC
jgi:DHA1 family multidrug resistance protein-like MFS transporter